MSKGSIVIFGATGTVGAYSSALLTQHGYKVIAVGRRAHDSGFFQSQGGEYHSVDIQSSEDFAKLPRTGIKAVLHFAGSMPSKMQGYRPEEYIKSIMLGTLNVLDYTRSVSAEKIVFTQTRADSVEYFGSETPLPDDIPKSFPKTGDHAVYTICKNAAVDLIEHYHHEYGFHRFIFRLPTIYTYHPDTYFYVNGTKREKAYWKLIRKAMNGEDLEIWGDPSKKKEIFYVKDMARAVLAAVESPRVGGTYNVGRGVGVTLEEQIKGITEVFSRPDRPSKIIYAPEKPDGRQFIHSVDKIRSELGFVPEYDYKSMLLDIKNEMVAKPFAPLWGSGDF